jgi:acetyl esterase
VKKVSAECGPDLETDSTPSVVVLAGFDILRDEVEAYARALSECGTNTRVERFPALGHGFIHLTTVCTAAHRAMLQIADARCVVLKGRFP